MAEKAPITLDGFNRIKAELHDLKTTQRNKISQEIATAREHGDLKENAEYHAAREKQSFLEGRVIELEDKIARAEIIDVSKLSGKDVKFGATVTLLDEDTEDRVTYQIVGVDEADIKKGKLSINAPLARALISKSVGDTCDITTPGKGHKSYEILDVAYA